MLTSRVHPGETGASWMIHGVMDTLLNPSTDEEKMLVKNLKDHFEFFIIPMLNVDGVINGNYRCSLAACDLNRKWIKPSKALHPTVYYTCGEKSEGGCGYCGKKFIKKKNNHEYF
jgi:murein tripeptide amidase MpaA